MELQQIVEGLVLQKTKPSAAAIHRQVTEIAQQEQWPVPSYSTVYDIIRSLDPALVKLAHEGTKAYRQHYDLLFRREAGRPNEIWQADHTKLDIWLLDGNGRPKRPWLTAIEDDYSRCIAGYFLTFSHPNALNTALTLRQAIWRKPEARWRICGIPEIFYTDHGSDFTSLHLEQVCADLKMQLIFSTVGMPRGRGRVERFFKTVGQLLLHRLPGYGPDGRPVNQPSLTLEEFEIIFQEFLLGEYHQRQQKDLAGSPQARWEGEGFLPQMPESLEKLDLLLLTVARTRKVHRDGIRFQSLRYIDPTLADYVGEDVVIRYDPRDMAEIRVFFQGSFLCQAVCQDLAGQTVSLKEIIRARNRRRQALRGTIKERSALIQTYLAVHDQTMPLSESEEEPESSPESESETAPQAQPLKRLKRYYNE
jgi:putative transposase